MQPKKICLVVAFIALLGFVLSSPPAVAQLQPFNPQRGIGIAITFPFPFLPTVPVTNSAMFFLHVLAQGQFSQELAHQLELRFFFDSTGFQAALTSVRESLLVLFTPPPAVFYLGAGAGVFPVRIPIVPSDGLLFSMLVRAGVEVQVAILGLFLDISYEMMPQPFADIAGGTFTPATISTLQLTFGALIHF